MNTFNLPPSAKIVYREDGTKVLRIWLVEHSIVATPGHSSYLDIDYDDLTEGLAEAEGSDEN